MRETALVRHAPTQPLGALHLAAERAPCVNHLNEAAWLLAEPAGLGGDMPEG